MYDIEKTVKHFESLQKRYTKEHNGQMCERVADALEALESYKASTEIHAHWIEERWGMFHAIRCSHCNADLPFVETGCTLEHPDFRKDYIDKTDYCPHCGANMKM